jgi:hypothetical protein
LSQWEKPWEAEGGSAPIEVYEPKGMIGPEERRCYYWLGKNWLSGQGCIVDAGAFLGASTFCFAAGAAAGGRRDFHGGTLVHAYDYFKVVDRYVGDRIARDFRPIAIGESYLDIFESQTAKYHDIIQVHPGDFLAHHWHGDPIDILFVDIAKTASLNAHVIGEFFSKLIPGHSIVVHQDYYHCWHPYIHISMEFFDEEFELVDEHVRHQSRVWRLMKPLSAEKIGRMRTYDLSREERMVLLDRVVRKSSASFRPMVEVARLWQHRIDRDYAAARTDLGRIRQTYCIDHRSELWALQALRIEDLLARQK